MRLSDRCDIRGRLWPFAVALVAILVVRDQQPTSASQAGNRIAAARFARSADGLTVHDALLHVTWLADASYPANQKFGLPIRDSGAMTYQVARRWVAALNASDRGAGYLGHKDWTLPATPQTDETCSVARGPHGNSFGFNCANSTLGSLYYRGLGLRQPETAVAIPPGKAGPFRNFQPYLYWSLNGKDRNQRQLRRENGDHAFSFNTGWQGGNVSDHVMYVLPMIPGPFPGTTPARGTELQPGVDGQTVYDPVAKVTWVANANLAAEMRFGVAGIVSDGAMARNTADAFIKAMNGYNGKGYLGQARWQLPPTYPDPSCTMPEGGYDCIGSPMGGLYYRLIKMLGLQPGEPVIKTPDVPFGPFHNIQPYLYWSCAGNKTACSGAPAAPGFQWSFSFGNGFQGTDVISNSLYVMVYAPDQPR
jgi:hypothetical protein